MQNPEVLDDVLHALRGTVSADLDTSAGVPDADQAAASFAAQALSDIERVDDPTMLARPTRLPITRPYWARMASKCAMRMDIRAPWVKRLRMSRSFKSASAHGS